ncbi:MULTISPECIES: L-histidine N(alpha)-methyltransferase [Cyanophyceae]|uniref:L-histidine N(alpha)-methyltransferase n=1 Tax=Cyanophyceae TaxID=3028117 RepID=UPI0004AAD797|nr:MULTISPECIES: L-histidine N(alpha)-methyltransferase [Cyanophyceae]
MPSQNLTLNSFALDVHRGLSHSPKSLPCKYFYDAQGDALFQQIMTLDEYYLTRCEREIFLTQKQHILDLFYGDRQPFTLVELGAGDGSKTKILLDYFLSQAVDFIYAPVDISENILTHLTETIQADLPNLSIAPIQGDYFHTDFLDHDLSRRKILLFLGSTIGNLSDQETADFLQNITRNLDPGDLIMLGFDLMKDPQIILKAYDDSQGVTRAFNLNLLERINRELEGDFQLDHFQHCPIYHPLTGEAQSYLVSTCTQTVTLNKLSQSYIFEAWEAIHMETSRKYSRKQIKELAEQHHFRVLHTFSDQQKYYVNSVWQKLAD